MCFGWDIYRLCATARHLGGRVADMSQNKLLSGNVPVTFSNIYYCFGCSVPSQCQIYKSNELARANVRSLKLMTTTSNNTKRHGHRWSSDRIKCIEGITINNILHIVSSVSMIAVDQHNILPIISQSVQHLVQWCNQ